MCDLASAEICHGAIEPHLDGWAAECPGGAIVAYLHEGEVAVRIFKSFSKAEKFQRTDLTAEQRRGSVLLELLDRIAML